MLRRSLPSIGGLIGLLLAVGASAVMFLDFPSWFPPVFALVMVGIQYALNPLFIQWLVPARVIPHDGTRYLTDDPLGALVARRCADAGIPLVTLGIVDDGTPNAFTFGHTPKDARVWLTRGLVERLDDDELDAVVCHELGHIKHWDFVVMTVAAAIPLTLYFIYLMARGSRREGAAVAIGAYISYMVSQLMLLALSRARELGADRWSCECTGNGDALASALVKVAYGMGQVRAEQAERFATLRAGSKDDKKELAREQRAWQRSQSLHALGIFDARQSASLEATMTAQGINPRHAMGAMRWELVNPWGAVLEKMSSHPLVARRIEALERSGLPGAPKVWRIGRTGEVAGFDERSGLIARFSGEVAMAVAPMVALAVGLVVAAVQSSDTAFGLALVACGLLLVAKQVMRYPTHDEGEVPEITGLLARIDASPVRGIPVTIRGRVMGRGQPGYVLSPDLVVADDSGFVPLLYRQPLPFARAWFGLMRVRDYMGRDVVARGWYRRMPGPVLELRSLTADGARPVRCWEWVARYAGSVAMCVFGLVVLALGGM